MPSPHALRGAGLAEVAQAVRFSWAKSPPGSQTLSPEALHGPHGIGLQAIKLSPCHAGLAEPRFQRLLSALGFAGRLLSPRSFEFR